VGTAPEQKTESAKSGLNVVLKPLFYKCIFDFISARASPCPTSLLYDNLSTARFSHFIDSLRAIDNRPYNDKRKSTVGANIVRLLFFVILLCNSYIKAPNFYELWQIEK
jgi:hypothetical protein